MPPIYLDIILPVRVNQTFTYAVPSELQEKVAFGLRVEVPFGVKKFYAGLIVDVHENKPDYEVKYIATVLDEVPLISPWQYDFWTWMADYYMASIGDIMRTALPSALQVSSTTKIKLTDKFESLNDLYAIANSQNRMTLELAIEILNKLKADKFVAIDEVVKNAKSKNVESKADTSIKDAGTTNLGALLKAKLDDKK